MANARDKAQQGVEAVTVSPGQAAARQKNAYTAGVTANADKWARNVSAVTTQEWQQAYITKGLDRMASGAAAAEGKVTNFMNKLLPAISSIRATLPSRGTYEQNKARAVAMMDGLHKQSFK
jgi:predicted transcriptional regulator